MQRKPDSFAFISDIANPTASKGAEALYEQWRKKEVYTAEAAQHNLTTRVRAQCTVHGARIPVWDSQTFNPTLRHRLSDSSIVKLNLIA
eukprot:1419072-Amphidinium_carterae.1